MDEYDIQKEVLKRGRCVENMVKVGETSQEHHREEHAPSNTQIQEAASTL